MTTKKVLTGLILIACAPLLLAACGSEPERHEVVLRWESTPTPSPFCVATEWAFSDYTFERTTLEEMLAKYGPPHAERLRAAVEREEERLTYFGAAYAAWVEEHGTYDNPRPSLGDEDGFRARAAEAHPGETLHEAHRAIRAEAGCTP